MRSSGWVGDQFFVFFFQAEDGIRDSSVTGVQTCALPISPEEAPEDADGFLVEAGDPWTAVSTADCAPVALVAKSGALGTLLHSGWRGTREIGRASCRERV